MVLLWVLPLWGETNYGYTIFSAFANWSLAKFDDEKYMNETDTRYLHLSLLGMVQTV